METSRMEMNQIRVLVGWSDKNWSAGNIDDLNGTVLVTSKSFDGVQSSFLEALRKHVEWSIQDGDSLPQWLSDGKYELIWEYTPSATLKRAESLTTLTAISKVTGINVRQLGHYANGWRIPRPAMQQRIKNGIKAIARQLSSL